MNTIKLLQVKPSGEASVLTIEDTLENLQQAAECQWIEGLYGEDWHCYLDEEGKLSGPNGGPKAHNNAAQVLYSLSGGPHLMPGDMLCGTVIFLSSNDEGDSADVPEHILTTAREMGILR